VKRKRVALFGSTGSIGRSTLDVISRMPDRFELTCLAARSSGGAVLAQARRFGVRHVVLTDWPSFEKVRPGRDIELGFGLDALIVEARKADVVVMAMSGTMGVLPVLAALERGRRVCLATKEILVSFGEHVMAAARRHKAPIMPIDSELSAIHQCVGGRADQVSRVFLTASGGPFWKAGAPARTTLKQALNHPTWRMGAKITVDSATLMNKGLEVIETCRLFGLAPDRVEAVIHPQSAVHALVEFEDGSVLAQLAQPDMRLPIQYALTWPDRLCSPVAGVHPERLKRLDFAPIDPKRFPCFGLAREALDLGQAGTCVLNAANEIAVRSFLAHGIGYHDIAAVVSRTLSAWRRLHRGPVRAGVNRLLEIEAWASAFSARLTGHERKP